jgi:ribosomal-protein-alanine N-acetyltransferase
MEAIRRRPSEAERGACERSCAGAPLEITTIAANRRAEVLITWEGIDGTCTPPFVWDERGECGRRGLLAQVERSHFFDVADEENAAAHRGVVPGLAINGGEPRNFLRQHDPAVDGLIGRPVTGGSVRDDGCPLIIWYPMRDKWTERVPPLHGDVTTLRELVPSDVYPLFTLFSDPAVTAYMAPPPPTLAKFAGFVEWSHGQRAQGRGVCFGIVPGGMTAAVGILQVRPDPVMSDAEWGFVLSAHFWSTGVFADAANVLAEFAFTTMHVDGLEARIALRNRRAQAAVQKLGARFGSTLPASSPQGVPRDPESVWTLREHDWRNRARDPRMAAHDAARRIRTAVEAAESALRRSDAPETVEPYPLFLFDRRRRE